MPDTHLQALSNAQTIRESKGRSIIAFPDTYCVIDVETTGRSPQWDHIIEVAALKISDGQEVGRFSSLIQPPSMPGGAFVDEFIAALTGITDEMLESAPFAPDVLAEFASSLGIRPSSATASALTSTSSTIPSTATWADRSPTTTLTVCASHASCTPRCPTTGWQTSSTISVSPTTMRTAP